MEVIALTGPAGCGKTHTLNGLSWYMTGHGYKELLIGLPYERIAVLTANGEDRIGIIHAGDDAAQLKADLKAVQDAGCIKVVCSCRDSGETPAAVQAYKHQLVPKTIVTKREDIVPANRKDMHLLLGLL